MLAEPELMLPYREALKRYSEPLTLSVLVTSPPRRRPQLGIGELRVIQVCRTDNTVHWTLGYDSYKSWEDPQ